MDARYFSNVAEQLQALPAAGAGRDRRLHQLTDRLATAAAADALHAAAAEADGASDVLATALRAARAVWSGDDSLAADDTVARESLHAAVASPEFLALLPVWIRELRRIAVTRPDTGACTLATALELWWWTSDHFRGDDGAHGELATRAAGELADALCPLLAARCLVLEIADPASPGTPTEVALRTDLSHVHVAHAASAAGAACAELVFGYRRHLRWDDEGCAACFRADEVDALEAVIPGLASGARAAGDVIEPDGSHPAKAGPCARFDGVDTFTRLRTRLDGCLSGARFARDRAATTLARHFASTAAPTGAPEGRAR